MKYYAIWRRTGHPETHHSEPTFIVESREVAEHICGYTGNGEYFYREMDTDNRQTPMKEELK